MNRFLVIFMLSLAACTGSAPEVNATAQIVRVYASSAAQPWLVELYTCADEEQSVLSLVNNPALADISLRLGEPAQISSPIYQVDQDDLLVVSLSENLTQNTVQTEVQELFANPNAQGIQVWVFSSGEDIQQVFEREIMDGRRISSLARLAVDPQQMSNELSNDINAVGLLPRHLKTGNMREIFILRDVPVIAQVKSEPQNQIKTLLACLKK